MSHHQPSRTGFAWLELLLVLAFLWLLFQVFPSLWWSLWAALDVRTWSRTTWFVFNLLVLVGLFGIRFGPELYAGWRERRKRTGINKKRQATSVSHTDSEYEARDRRDAEWRERAKKRLPWR